MFTRKTLLASMSVLALCASACTDDINDGDEPATGDEAWLDYGELMPGPDYDRNEDQTYLDLVASGEGPQTHEEADSQALFEQGMVEASQDIWLALPTITADEFPQLTAAERDQIISDYQGLVALGALIDDSGEDPDCVEIFATDEATGEPTWQPLCIYAEGPDIRGNWVAGAARLVTAVAKPVGRWVVKKAAPAVGRFATRQFQNAKVYAGAAVKYVRMQLPVVKMAAYKAATWAKNQAVAGYANVKNFYKAASQYRLVKIAKFVATGYAVDAGVAVVNWLYQKAFGGPTETTTQQARSIQMLLDGSSSANPDLLFDVN
jgi:hypothetical protein